MRVVVLGGTGLLGHETALALLARGHAVTLVASGQPPRPLPGLASVPLVLADVFGASDDELASVVGGFDGLVYALGPDDREHVPAPAAAYFQRMLADQTERVCRVARSVGVRRIVILGSYFTAWEREHPGSGFARRHTYVRARIDQAARAIVAGGGAAGGGADVCVLEIPYVFGAVAGREPMWKTWLFDRLSAMRGVVFYPRGGSTVVTSRQCGEAAAGAIERGEHGRSYPVGSADLTWPALLRLILDAMGRPRTPVVTVPRLLAEPAARSMGREMRTSGMDSGLDPDWLMRDIMYREFFVDWRSSVEALGYAVGGLPEIRSAIADTVAAAYAG